MGTGILLVQLGTPDAPTAPALRRYLRQFLTDPRVIDLPRWLWLPLLYGPILTLRPRRSAALYRRIWTADGSPLLVHTRRQGELLQRRLAGEARVEIGMRYGTPSIASGLERLLGGGARRLLVAPLFPQFSHTTVSSVQDGVAQALRSRAGFGAPALHTLPSFCDAPPYISALASRAREIVEAHGPPDRWIFSFHGIPQRYVRKGDVYPTQCAATARALAAALQLSDERWTLAYQSRFGPEPWLRPYTDAVLTEWAARGVRDVYALCPGFVSDCLETLDEIGEVAARRFRAAGGGTLRLVPCLNDHPDWIEALERLIRAELSTWEAQADPAAAAAQPLSPPTPGALGRHFSLTARERWQP